MLQNAGYTMGDGVVAVALAGSILGYLYLKYREKQLRFEMIHQERLAAMEKGIPLPEIPFDPPSVPNRQDPLVPLQIGIVLLSFGAGAMITLRLIPAVDNRAYWPLPLPLAMVGLGLILYHFLASKRER